MQLAELSDLQQQASLTTQELLSRLADFREHIVGREGRGDFASRVEYGSEAVDQRQAWSIPTRRIRPG